MSILLVEDDPSIAIVITAALEAEGFEVTCCDSVAERDRLLHFIVVGGGPPRSSSPASCATS